MTKEELIQMLRLMAADENTITAMCNAYDLGVEWAQGNLVSLPVKDEKWVKE
jgi:hypothetical protein